MKSILLTLKTFLDKFPHFLNLLLLFLSSFKKSTVLLLVSVLILPPLRGDAVPTTLGGA